jgi:hypothetical protein
MFWGENARILKMFEDFGEKKPPCRGGGKEAFMR